MLCVKRRHASHRGHGHIHHITKLSYFSRETGHTNFHARSHIILEVFWSSLRGHTHTHTHPSVGQPCAAAIANLTVVLLQPQSFLPFTQPQDSLHFSHIPRNEVRWLLIHPHLPTVSSQREIIAWWFWPTGSLNYWTRENLHVATTLCSYVNTTGDGAMSGEAADWTRTYPQSPLPGRKCPGSECCTMDYCTVLPSQLHLMNARSVWGLLGLDSEQHRALLWLGIWLFAPVLGSCEPQWKKAHVVLCISW